MDLDHLPIEIERSRSRLAKQDLRSEQLSGWGATTGGKALTGRYHERLTEAVQYALLDAHRGSKVEADLVVLSRELDPKLLALLGLQTVLHSIGLQDNLKETLLSLGKALSDECWAAGLLQDNAKKTAMVRQALREAAKRNASVSRRVASARKSITKLHDRGLIDFKARVWTDRAYVTAGGWLWNIVATALPEVFVRVSERRGRLVKNSITLSPGAWDIVRLTSEQAALRRPVFWPSHEQPKPWDAWTGGGSWDSRVNRSVTVLRTRNKDTQAAVKRAIREGTMKPALDALNTLQAVPFRINYRVLEALQRCDDEGIMVPGLVPADLPMVERPNNFAWEALSKEQKGLWIKKRAEVAQVNLGFMSDRIMFASDMTTAFEMLKHERFYTPMNLDWRGRVYALCHFNFQREDRVRALFNFAEGLPIGDDGLKWLSIHTANCGDFDKISKRPLEERVKWCNQNSQMIGNIALDPFVHTEWMHADKPFLFLAACYELSAAWEQGPSFITRLPLSFDGSCSGLQHLSAMTRAHEGEMVNLTPSPLPQDIYQTVADDTYARITADLDAQPDPDAEDADAEAKRVGAIREMARLFLAFDGNRRSIAKRNVMTYAYSSKKFGMAAQQQVDLIEPLSREVLEGKRAEHPLEGYQHGPIDKEGNQQPSKAARYLAGHVFEAIEARIHKPADAMKFLQSIAKALAHEGKPVNWTTPVGLPWINRYNPPTTTQVNMLLNDNGVRVRTRVLVATGDRNEIDKAKAANGIAPNFVHALDASHLLLVANAAASENISSIATVHDSFGCLAPQASRFNEVIREQFAEMYEKHDVLAEIYEQASCDLTHANRNKIPNLIEYGNLNLKDILHADFAFA